MAGRTLGLDVGDKRIGVAISDALSMTAQPLGVVQRKSIARDCEAIMALASEYEVVRIVAGLPLNMDGSEGEQSQKVRRFCDTFARNSGIDLIYEDERMTSAQSERMLIESGMRRDRRRKVIDKMAATLILQSYLDRASVPSQ